MTAVTQTIPNYVFGISQQPDQLKQPGQLRDSVNVTPDVVTGLNKRPGSRFIANTNTDVNGKFFSYYRNETEQYYGHIATNGNVRIWNVLTGIEANVVQLPAADQYLVHTESDDLQLCTINDFTFVTNRGTQLNAQGERVPRQSPALVGGPIDRTAPPVGGDAGIKILWYVTDHAEGTTLNATDVTVTQFNSPDDPGVIPEGMAVDYKVEVMEYTDGTGATQTQNEVVGINFASTIAITNGGAGIVDPDDDADPTTFSFEDEECTFTGVFTGEKMTVSGEVTNGVVTTVTLDNPGQFTWMGTSTFTIKRFADQAAATDPELTHTERADARGENWQNGDVFWVDDLDGPQIGNDRPIFQIIDRAYGTPFQPSAYVNLKVLAYGREYRIDVKNDDGEDVFGVIVDSPAASTTQIGAVETVLEPLQELIINARPNPDAAASSPDNEVYGFGCEIIGNGLYITFNQDFAISVSDAQLLETFTDEVNNIERLPFQCADGYVVKVTNTSNADDDDFFVEFKGHLGVSGEGSWNETCQPDIQKRFWDVTMPHQIISTALNEFTVQVGEFTEREVGDEDTNPTPSFVDNGVINNIVLFRNRLCYLSGEDINATTSGGLQPADFWSTTALSVLSVDPIDLSAASKKPAILWDAIEINNGLLLFAETQQYLLTTDSDILTNETAKISAVSYYQYFKNVSPWSMGVTVGFTDTSGRNFRFFEMSNLLREGEPTVSEITRIVGQLTAPSIKWVADSREGTIILFSDDDDLVWGYRYFQDGDQRKQSAWFKWRMPGEVIYHCIMQDVYYAVVRIQTGTDTWQHQLIELDLKRTDATSFVDLPEGLFRIHMDNRVVIPALAAGAYDGTNTTFPMPVDPNNGGDELITFSRRTYAYMLENGTQQGVLREITWDNNTGSLRGNWTGTEFQIGYLFDMLIDIPRFYVTESSGNVTKSDVRSSLTIHRMQISTGATGTYDVNLDILGKDNRIINVLANVMNTVQTNAPMLEPHWEDYIQIYERSKNVDITITTDHPSPFALYSIAWEGDYTKRWYRSV